MKKEAVELDYNYYYLDCDFEDLKCAVEKLTHASGAQFEEIKKEKWYHRLFNMITFSKKGEKRMAEQIGTLVQAQQLLVEILLRLSLDDKKVKELVNTCMVDICSLQECVQENKDYMLMRIHQLEDIVILGIREIEDVRDLEIREKQLLSGCLRKLSGLYQVPSAAQQQYANSLLNFIAVDAEVENIPKDMSAFEEAARRKILTCMMEYMALADESLPEEQEDEFIDNFDIGRKTIREIKKRIVDTLKMRGPQGLIDKFCQFERMDISDTFYVELPDDTPPEESESTETCTEANEATTSSDFEEITISHILHIQPGETRLYQNKIIHFQAMVNCEGGMVFDNCVLHYNESDASDEIKLTATASLMMQNCTVINHGYDKHFFLDAAQCTEEIRMERCKFVNCCWFLDAGGGVRIEQCKMVDIGSYFIDQHYYGDNKCVITACEFSFLQRPAFFPEKDSDDIITCTIVEMSQCTVTGTLQLSSASAAEEHLDKEREKWRFSQTQYFLYAYEKATITGCSFYGVYNLFDRNNLMISFSSFQHCSDIASNSTLKVEDCNFEHCTTIGIALWENSQFSYCQFNDCYGNLIFTSFDGRVKISFCEFNNWFNNWEAPEKAEKTECAMMTFNLTRGGVSSTVEKCVFNGMMAQQSFVIEGSACKKLKCVSVHISECTFQNCTTKRDDGKIIKDYDTYFLHLSNPKSFKTKNQQVVSISDCRGLDKVNQGNGYDDTVQVRKTTSTGAVIGTTTAITTAGALGLPAPRQ